MARPQTPVFFQNFAPPKKAKKNTLASKKRYQSQNAKPVNLLISILHSHDKPLPKAKDKGKGKALGGKKKSITSSKRNVSLPLNMNKLNSRRSSKMSSNLGKTMSVSQFSAVSKGQQSPRFDQTLSSIDS